MMRKLTICLYLKFENITSVLEHYIDQVHRTELFFEFDDHFNWFQMNNNNNKLSCAAMNGTL